LPFLVKKSSTMPIDEVAGKCKRHYHGKIHKVGGKQSKKVAIQAGVLYEFYFVREAKSNSGNTIMIDHRTDASFLFPKEDIPMNFK